MFLTKQSRHWLSWPQGETCITALALQQIMHYEREKRAGLVVTVYFLSPYIGKDVESWEVHLHSLQLAAYKLTQ